MDNEGAVQDLTRQFEKETEKLPEEILYCAVINFETIARQYGCSSDPIYLIAMAQLKGTAKRLEDQE